MIKSKNRKDSQPKPKGRKPVRKNNRNTYKKSKVDVSAQLQTLVEDELEQILKIEPLILPIDDQTFQISDYQLQVKDDQSICKHKNYIIKEFYTKQCAILYIFSLINRNSKVSDDLVRLDEELLRLKSDEQIMSHQAKIALKTDSVRAEVLQHRLFEVNARIKRALGTIKKYRYLAKYRNKGILV